MGDSADPRDKEKRKERRRWLGCGLAHTGRRRMGWAGRKKRNGPEERFLARKGKFRFKRFLNFIN